MTRDKAIRYYLGNILSPVGGAVFYNSSEIPFWDEKAQGSSNNIYCLFANQSASDIGNFTQQRWLCDFTIEICVKTPDRTSKDITDDVAEQIEDLLYAALRNGTTTNNWQINNFRLQNSFYEGMRITDTETVLRKNLVFQMDVTKIS